jgi:integrase
VAKWIDPNFSLLEALVANSIWCSRLKKPWRILCESCPSSIWELVKQYARAVGIDADRVGRRGVGVHSLRKTAITNSLQNVAPIEKVQQLAGHSDIRTTQLYYKPSAQDAEYAARHIQIR